MKSHELLTRVLCDTSPSFKVDGAFLFSQTENNQESVFITATQLVKDALVSKILLMKTSPMSGYPGYLNWKEELETKGISEWELEGVPSSETTSLNTLIESRALIRFSKLNGYKTLFVVSSPFHQLRALMTAVTVAIQEYPALRIYSKPGSALSWPETVRHSQGTLSGTRSKLVWSEMERIEKYQKKGDLGTFDSVLTYLDLRDQSLNSFE